STRATSGLLLVATTNPGKVREFASILGGTGYKLRGPSDIGITLDVEETADTYVGNARLKARAYFAAAGMTTVAEDSGIEIDALSGEPGVHSARYEGLPDGPIKNSRILARLRDARPS